MCIVFGLLDETGGCWTVRVRGFSESEYDGGQAVKGGCCTSETVVLLVSAASPAHNLPRVPRGRSIPPSPVALPRLRRLRAGWVPLCCGTSRGWRRAPRSRWEAAGTRVIGQGIA